MASGFFLLAGGLLVIILAVVATIVGTMSSVFGAISDDEDVDE